MHGGTLGRLRRSGMMCRCTRGIVRGGGSSFFRSTVIRRRACHVISRTVGGLPSRVGTVVRLSLRKGGGTRVTSELGVSARAIRALGGVTCGGLERGLGSCCCFLLFFVWGSVGLFFFGGDHFVVRPGFGRAYFVVGRVGGESGCSGAEFLCDRPRDGMSIKEGGPKEGGGAGYLREEVCDTQSFVRRGL